MYHTDKSFFPKAQNFVYTMADRYFKSWMGGEFYLILLDIYWDGYTVLNYVNKVSNAEPFLW